MLKLVFTLVVLACINYASAGVEPSESGEKQRPSQKPKYPDVSELKCWQNGKLIFDERNWYSDRAAFPGVQLKSQGSEFDTMWLSNFGAETFCYLKAKTEGY